MHKKLLSIGEASKILGVSIDTLRRWDASGRLPSIRSGTLGHRFYNRSDIDKYLQKIEITARTWAESQVGYQPDLADYCQTRDVFQARLETLESKLEQSISKDLVSLVAAITGEIGNNSFDHNIRVWPDLPGIFFAFDLSTKKIVLADRGQGILTTLQRVRPALKDSSEAMRVAFTEIISGRLNEARGNGLKFVRIVVIENELSLYFQTGESELYLKKGDKDLSIHLANKSIIGCIAIISF